MYQSYNHPRLARRNDRIPPLSNQLEKINKREIGSACEGTTHTHTHTHTSNETLYKSVFIQKKYFFFITCKIQRPSDPDYLLQQLV